MTGTAIAELRQLADGTGGAVFSVGSTGRLYAYDAKTGNKLWEGDIGPMHQRAEAEKTVEANVEAAQKLGAVKNPQEFLDLQAKLAKAAYDDFVAESAKLQDLSVKVSSEAAQPLNERLNKAVETFAKTIAA